jgi:hypothetical protein
MNATMNHNPALRRALEGRTTAQEAGVQIAGLGGIEQAEITFGRLPQVVLRVAAVATVLAPPVMIPVLVADLAQMSQRRARPAHLACSGARCLRHA